MPKAFRIVCCEFSSPNLDEELAYYTNVLGMTETHKSPDGAHFLSLGLDHHNIALRPGETADLLSTGFQLSADVKLPELHKECRERGFPGEIKQDSRPGVAELLEVSVAGYRFEFFADMEISAPGFAAHGIVPSRIGHTAMITPQADEMVRFFDEVLGFYTTDWFEGLATFMTCNRDHHAVNIIAAPLTKMHHIAYELRGAAHQYVASDQLAKAQHPIVWGPSRHTAGHNYASYHLDPDRTLIEFYTDMDVYLPDVGYFEPRPWHEDMPQRPKHWSPTDMNAWKTNFDFDFRTLKAVTDSLPVADTKVAMEVAG